MTEYIVDWDENLVIDTFSKNSLREEIVRCRDCKHFHAGVTAHTWCARLLDMDGNILTFNARPEDYCAWGVPRFTTCKCGESIELGDRESAVCPMCGRMVRS